MKKLVLLLGILVLLPFLVAACGEDLQPRVEELEELAGPPPEFLDQLYPPQATEPTFLIEMLALDEAMVGLFVDLSEQDFANISGDLAKFKTQYDKMRNEVVPEWKDLMPLEPVTGLEEALASQDPDEIMPAAGEVGEICGNCHALYMAKVTIKYHWPSFEEVKVTDLLSEQQLSWADFKMPMALNFGGIGHNLQQGQLDNAMQNFQAFNAQFDALRKTCSDEDFGCHSDEPLYFVSKDVQADIDALGGALTASPPDATAIAELMPKIGQESCGGCHTLHVPAAATMELWETMEE